ncbi:Uncharacterized protein Fot_04305 [Forsythia ovata]|uniref:Uncharacterized protein n=1 Tax=Forsythia ovata TaxID=205694 RepID=A0ABD1XCS8_9LAMI
MIDKKSVIVEDCKPTPVLDIKNMLDIHSNDDGGPPTSHTHGAQVEPTLEHSNRLLGLQVDISKSADKKVEMVLKRSTFVGKPPVSGCSDSEFHRLCEVSR